jgi:hypothetical protein
MCASRVLPITLVNPPSLNSRPGAIPIRRAVSNVPLRSAVWFGKSQGTVSVRASGVYDVAMVRTTVGKDFGHSPGMLIAIDCIADGSGKRKLQTPRSAKKRSRR